MEVRDITEYEREELAHAVEDRYDKLDKLKKKASEDGMSDVAEAYNRRLGTVGDLKRLFAGQADIEDEKAVARAKKGETRDADGQPDMFGGGAEIVGGIPAGQIIVGVRSFDGVANPMDASGEPLPDLPPLPTDLDEATVDAWRRSGPFTMAPVAADPALGNSETTYRVTIGDAEFEEQPFAYKLSYEAEQAAAWYNLRAAIAARQVAATEAAAVPAVSSGDDVADAFGTSPSVPGTTGETFTVSGYLTPDDPGQTEPADMFADAAPRAEDTKSAPTKTRAKRVPKIPGESTQPVDVTPPVLVAPEPEPETTQPVSPESPTILGSPEPIDDLWDAGPAAHRDVNPE